MAWRLAGHHPRPRRLEPAERSVSIPVGKADAGDCTSLWSLLASAASTDSNMHEDWEMQFKPALVNPCGRSRYQSSSMLGVKPAIEDVNASGFLAFPFA